MGNPEVRQGTRQKQNTKSRPSLNEHQRPARKRVNESDVVFKEKQKRERVFFVLACVAVAVLTTILIFLIISLMNSLNKTTINEPLYQMEMGVREDLAAPITISSEDNGTLKATSEGTTITLSALPLYSYSRTSAYIPSSTVWVDPTGAISTTKASELSHLVVNGNKVSLNDQETHGGFLYDGDNTYILLETAMLTANNQTFELPALSYVIADPEMLLIFAYNAQGDDFQMIPALDSVSITCDSSTGAQYEIDILSDTLLSGTKAIVLISDPDRLNSNTAK